MQAVMVVAIGRRADPLVPVQAGRNGLGGGPAARAAEVPVQDRVRLGDLADGAGGNVLGNAADRLAAIALVAHLRQHLLLPGSFGQRIALGDVLGERLLAKNVFAVVDGPHGRRGMVVIGGGDQDHVDIVVALVEQFAIVVKNLRPGRVLDALLHDLGNVLLVHVRQSHELLAQCATHGVGADARRADHGHPQLVARRPLGQHEGPAGDAGQHAADRGRRTFEKATPRATFGHDAEVPFIRIVDSQLAGYATVTPQFSHLLSGIKICLGACCGKRLPQAEIVLTVQGKWGKCLGVSPATATELGSGRLTAPMPMRTKRDGLASSVCGVRRAFRIAGRTPAAPGVGHWGPGRHAR